MTPFTPEQRRELRDAIARSRADAEKDRAARDRQWKEEQQAARRLARQPRKSARPVLPTKSERLRAPTAAETALADRLLPHVCPDSPIDRPRHALSVARMVLKNRGRA